MIDPQFKIYIDGLEEHGSFEIEASVKPTFLDTEGEEISFSENVNVDGEAYLAEGEIVVRCAVSTAVNIPCKICNTSVSVSIDIPEFYHIEPLKNVHSKFLDVTPFIREEIFLNTPLYAECNDGECEHRKTLKKYQNSTINNAFSKLDLDDFKTEH